MSETIKEYDARIDSKKRLTLRESPFEYYHVEHHSDGSILLQPRELVEPFSLSRQSLRAVDESMAGLKNGDASEPIDLSEFED